MKYQGGKKSMKFLNEMKGIIPFEAIEKILIEKNIYKPNKGKTGRPSIPAKVLVAALCKKRSKSDTYDTSIRTLMTVSFGQ